MNLLDWADHASRPLHASGSKARVGANAKSAYSDWRRTVGHRCFANDLDWVEWRVDAAGPRFVALIETTFYEDKPELRHVLPTYCGCALARFKRDGQHDVVVRAAHAFGVPAYFVIVRYDCEMFFVCRLRDEVWRQMSEPQYRRWIMRLGEVR